MYYIISWHFSLKKRNVKTNIRLILLPVILCVLLVVIQGILDNLFDKPEFKCGCICANNNNTQPQQQQQQQQSSVNQCSNQNEKLICGYEYSSLSQIGACAIPNPPQWPPLLQLPSQLYSSIPSNPTRPVKMLFTAANFSFGQSNYLHFILCVCLLISLCQNNNILCFFNKEWCDYIFFKLTWEYYYVSFHQIMFLHCFIFIHVIPFLFYFYFFYQVCMKICSQAPSV